jgi:caffeoyl-CoA O-methyltransferase
MTLPTRTGKVSLLFMPLEIIHPLAEVYAGRYTTPVDDVLSEIDKSTSQNHSQPWMMSGHLQGNFLEMISKLMSPSRILEIGTMTGYSAVCLAKGLKEGGCLHTIEKREKDASDAVKNIEKAGLQDRVNVHTGDAKEIIPNLSETWDLVFIDADKTGYIDYYKLIFPRVRKGGLIIADNVLYHGEVLSEELKGKNAIAIQAFNQFIAEQSGIQTVMLTVRDGLMLILKNIN